MILFYQISIALYFVIIKIASIFNPKAKKWIDGRKNSFNNLKEINSEDNIYWFHCASLGELEQAKPVIEKLKEKDNSIKFLITIFSPSGYDFAKNYKEADYVFYLPLDTPSNAKRFIKIVNPKKAFFVKYEFWYNYLFELKDNKIPTYLISGVFRKNQLFFKWYGSMHKKMLSFFTHFFVQNELSKTLLSNLDFNNITISGDTRLDRVYENSLNPKKPELIQEFIGNKKTIILGSSWSNEEKLITEFIQSTKKDFKFIIAPHDIKNSRIKSLEKLLTNTNYIKYSNVNVENISEHSVLVIDNIGILANIYQFTDIAFVGGGFKGALHNTLEPASFGNAILFGPKHQKFHEAEELLSINGAFEIKDLDDLIAVTNLLLSNNKLTDTQEINRNYISTGRGAAEKILNQLEL
ncbi:MAG: glycosyltransferase N-terminal domain-containing protein [Vicingaceae bacterium]|nr:glycosyltransferase N-terminal domain-containing protein [Vicingaceae bacterium]